MTTELKIFEALDTHIESLKSLPVVVFPNQGACSDTPRIEINHGTAVSMPYALDGRSKTSLLYQATIVTPAGGAAHLAMSLAQSVMAHFKAGTHFAEGWIGHRPDLGASYLDGSEWRLPITITVKAYLAA